MKKAYILLTLLAAVPAFAEEPSSVEQRIHHHSERSTLDGNEYKVSLSFESECPMLIIDNVAMLFDLKAKIPAELRSKMRIKVEMQDATVKEVLDYVTKASSCTWSFDGKTITIAPNKSR